MTSQEHQQIVDLFLAAVDLPEEERTAYLDRVCGDNANLRGELLDLLEHHDPRPLISDAGLSPIVGLLDLPLRAVPDDRYEIHGEIARGGMGVILRARDNEIGREVAIKVLLDSLAASPEALSRFVAEAQIAGQLQHPGVAPVYELGELPDGRPFFAMELVDGRSLSQILAQQASTDADQNRLIGIFEKICQTVAYAHARGVIHRDLKPANVIVGAFGQVQVLDWGLAKVLSQVEGDAPASLETPQTVRGESEDTSHGQLFATRLAAGMGTRGYASPEQTRGELAVVDRRSDVYSLGAMLCEILTGEPAMAKSARANGSPDEASLDPREPLARLDRCCADSALVELAKQCLSPEPDDRPPDASVVARRVVAYQQSVTARLQEAELAAARAEASTTEARKRQAVTIALAVAAVLLFVVGLSAWGWISEAQRQREAERTQREKLVTQSINDALGDAVRLRELARAASLTSVQPWRRAVEAAERAESFALGREIDQDLRAKIDETLTSLRTEYKNHRLFADIAAARIQPDDARLHYYNNKRMANRFTTAFRAYGVEPVAMGPTEAASTVRSQCGEHRSEVIRIANQWWLFDPRGRKTQETGRWVRKFVDALDVDPWRRAWRDEIGRTANNREAMLALIRDPATLDRPPGDLVNLAQGMVRTRQPWIGEIIGFLQEAERRHPRSIWIKYWIADYTARMESPELIQQGVRYSQTLTTLHPTAVNRVLHAILLRKAGAVDESEAELRDVLATSPNHVAALLEMAQIHALRSRWQQTLDCLDAATEASSSSTEYAKPSLVGVGLRGRVYMQLGRHEEAARVFERLAKSTPREAFRYYRRLGEAWLAMGRHQDAIDAFQLVEPKDSRTWILLAETYLELDDVASAISASRSAVNVDPQQAQAHYLLADALTQEEEWASAVESYRNAFSRDPAAKTRFIHLASAARAAILAMSLQDRTDLERDQLRHAARTWIKTALDHTAGSDNLSKRLASLLEDDCFDHVRDKSQLETLTADEREAWNKLWQEVAANATR